MVFLTSDDHPGTNAAPFIAATDLHKLTVILLSSKKQSWPLLAGVLRPISLPPCRISLIGKVRFIFPALLPKVDVLSLCHHDLFSIPPSLW